MHNILKTALSLTLFTLCLWIISANAKAKNAERFKELIEQVEEEHAAFLKREWESLNKE